MNQVWSPSYRYTSREETTQDCKKGKEDKINGRIRSMSLD